ncbi:MAG: hypothetical protein IJF48_01030 [Clostridia bacterium]|nr:hypothetical protein [Clostridia bacterium]
MPQTPVRHTAPNPPDTVTSQAKTKPALDPYYSAVSEKFRIAKYITVILLVVFLLFSFAFMRSDITLENLRYLLKFISFTNTETSITAAKINYASGDPNRLDLFIGDLCTLSPEGYALYDSRGNQIMAEDIKYSSPVLKTSSKFALCYDLDSTSFTVLNTFAKLYEGTSEYRITDGTIADDGTFAIASSSREYRTAITLYSSDFKPITRIYKNDHLMGLEMKADGTQLAVMTSGAADGKFFTNIELVVPGTDTILASKKLSGLGYSFYYTDTGFAVITDEGIHFLDSAFEILTSVEHPSQIAMSSSSGKYISIVYSNGIIGNNYTLRAYDTSGRLAYSGEFNGKLVGIDSDESGDYIFILTGTTLSRINLVNKKIAVTEVSSDAIDILVPEYDRVLVALKNYALTYELASLKEVYYDRANGDSADTSEN